MIRLTLSAFLITGTYVQCDEGSSAIRFGNCTNVLSGDTFEFKTSLGEELVLRLRGVAAPALDQPHGEEAKKALKKLCGSKGFTVTHLHLNKEKTHGIVSGCYPGDQRLRSGYTPTRNKDDNFSVKLVKDGHVWEVPARVIAIKDWDLVHVGFMKSELQSRMKTDQLFGKKRFEMSTGAKKARKGLWSNRDAVPPWNWKSKPRKKKLSNGQYLIELTVVNKMSPGQMRSLARKVAEETEVSQGIITFIEPGRWKQAIPFRF